MTDNAQRRLVGANPVDADALDVPPAATMRRDAAPRTGSTRSRALTLGAAVVAALGAGAVYAAAQNDSSPRPAGPVTTTAPAQRAGGPEVTYGTLSAARASKVRATGRVQQLIGVINRRFDVNPYAARGVRTASGKTAWIIPGAEDLCFGAPTADGVGYSCARGVELSPDRLLGSSGARDDGTITTTFLVPDAVAALEVDGRRVAPTNNTVTLRHRTGDRVTRIDRDGTRRVVAGE